MSSIFFKKIFFSTTARQLAPKKFASLPARPKVPARQSSLPASHARAGPWPWGPAGARHFTTLTRHHFTTVKRYHANAPPRYHFTTVKRYHTTTITRYRFSVVKRYHDTMGMDGAVGGGLHGGQSFPLMYT